MSFVKLNGLLLNINILKAVNCQIIHRCKEVRNYKCYNNTQVNCKGNIFKDENLEKYFKFRKSDFHTTIPNRALPPMLWVFIRSVLKITAVLTGRVLRMWWARLTPSGKQRIINKIRENQPKIWLGSFTFSGIVSFYYVSHLVQDPITKRKKFLLFSEKQILEISKMECDFILRILKNKITQSGDDYETVLKISQRILRSNRNFPGVEKKWEVFVINDIDKRNAFVLPSGHIFIFTGMLKIISNDDQLAVILAHEMAHALLNHSAEVISKTHFVELLKLLPILVIWTLLPDFIALSSHMLFEMISLVLFHLPMNRQMEVEADVVGLSMAAKACYDPRQATVFWKNMESLGEAEQVEWLSTHPRLISQVGFNVVCLICSKKLFEACINEKSMDVMLFDHLQSEQHIKNMKIWTCWIYFFNENCGFVMISQSKVYCSVCKQTIVIKGNTVLTALDSHLDLEHNVHLLRSENTSNQERNVVKNTNLAIELERSADNAVKDDHLENKLDCHQLRSPVDLKENTNFEHKYDRYPPKRPEDLKENSRYPPRSSEYEKDTYLKKEYDYCTPESPENEKENDHFENEFDHYPLEGPINVKEIDLRLLESADNNAKRKDHLENKFVHESQESPEDAKSIDYLENQTGSRPDMIPGDAKNNDSDMEENDIYSIQIPSINGDILGGSPGVKEIYGSEFDSESTDSEDYDDALEVLTCPVCGGFVEIINEDAEFSLQLHCQKHNDFKSVNTDNELAFSENVEYVCPICHEVIPLFNRNIELSIQRHFEERKIDHEGFGFTKSCNANPDLLDNTFSNFPEPLKKYQSFLIMEENKIICKLCNCEVPLGDMQSNISKLLYDHLANSFHEGQYMSLSHNLALVVLDYNKQYQSHQPNEQLELFEILVKKHPLIKENMQYIEKKGTDYFCQICQKHINASFNEHTLALNFMYHLRGPVHTKAFKEVEKSTSENRPVQRVKKDKEPQKQLKRKMTTTMFWVSTKFPEVHMNQNYFKIRVGTGIFYCVICNEPIKFSRNGSELKSHCNSSAHNGILTRIASAFVSSLCSLPRQKNNTERLKNILDSLASTEFLKPHVQFLFGDEQRSRCVVCDASVPTSKKNIQEHFFGNNHKDNAFKAVQLEVKKKRKPAKLKDPKELVKKSLATLLEYSPLVGKNSQLVDVKDKDFFCKVCCEKIKYSSSGKHLKTHLNSASHQKMMNRQTNVC